MSVITPTSFCSVKDYKCPDTECTLKVDVLIRCSDGVSYGAHERNLEMYSTGILKSTGQAEHASEIRLEHDSDIVGLLLKFMHNKPQPDLSTLAWDEFWNFALGAEKYRVYNAMGICRLKMEYSVAEHPYDVFLYASEVGYSELSKKALRLCVDTHPLQCFAKACISTQTELQDTVAARTLRLPAQEVLYALKVHDGWATRFSAWTMQREAYRKAYIVALKNPPAGSFHKHGLLRCDEWVLFHKAVVSDVYASEMTAYPDFVINRHEDILKGCKHCLIAVSKWRSSLQVEVKPFSVFYQSLTS